MNTFSIEELDREEIEFLPPRVVMTTCTPKPTCYQPVCRPCHTVEVCADVRVACLAKVECDISLF
jgi:hypothetical protein